MRRRDRIRRLARKLFERARRPRPRLWRTAFIVAAFLAIAVPSSAAIESTSDPSPTGPQMDDASWWERATGVDDGELIDDGDFVFGDDGGDLFDADGGEIDFADWDIDEPLPDDVVDAGYAPEPEFFSDEEIADTLGASGIPQLAVTAYTEAAAVSARLDPACGVPWTLLAAIGRVESDHGRFGGGRLLTDGYGTQPIRGLPLDGRAGRALIRDTDGGRLDGDTTYDRAVGPMQFIPSTWRNVAADGNDDGRRDPNNIFDATVGAAAYLCSGDGNLRNQDQAAQAVRRYNHTDRYVRVVLGVAAMYERDGGRVVTGGSGGSGSRGGASARPPPSARPGPRPGSGAPRSGARARAGSGAPRSGSGARSEPGACARPGPHASSMAVACARPGAGTHPRSRAGTGAVPGARHHGPRPGRRPDHHRPRRPHHHGARLARPRRRSPAGRGASGSGRVVADDARLRHRRRRRPRRLPGRRRSRHGGTGPRGRPGAGRLPGCRAARPVPAHHRRLRSGARQQGPHRVDRVGLGGCLVVPVAPHAGEPEGDAPGVAGRRLHPVERDLHHLLRPHRDDPVAALGGDVEEPLGLPGQHLVGQSLERFSEHDQLPTRRVSSGEVQIGQPTPPASMSPFGGCHDQIECVARLQLDPSRISPASGIRGRQILDDHTFVAV
jgi:Transglycosylase SLT domain